MLGADDRLLVLTDGFTEALTRPVSSMASRASTPSSPAWQSGGGTPLQALIRQVREFEAGRPAFDDMAAILLSLGRTAAP